MKPEDRKFLDENYQHWMTLQSGYIAGLNIHQRQSMLRCLREYFWPGYTYDEWCPDCVGTMVRHLYERYDSWLARQTEPPAAEPLVVNATFPVNERPEETKPLDGSMDRTEYPVKQKPKNDKRK